MGILSRWFTNRKAENLEEVKVEKQCHHKYHIVSEYTFDTFDGFRVELHDIVDLYCPKCDKELSRVTPETASKILKKQEIKESYEKQEADFKEQSERIAKLEEENKRYSDVVDYIAPKLRGFRRDANTAKKISREIGVQRELFSLEQDIKECEKNLKYGYYSLH